VARTLANRYVLAELIGAGGMADVYAAQDRRLSRMVAVKLLRSDLARDPQFVSRFKKEALSAAGLNHPAIVSVFDSGEEAGNSYIVMELVHGKTLRELMQNVKQLDVAQALEIISGVLGALEYSHQNGIVHRDIKPGNIMITENGEIKVMDFGIARVTDDPSATMTGTWNVVGTAQYLSPEQATGAVADERSDIYSVGCLLFEMLTGRTPFIGDTPVAIAYQHVSATPPSASEVNGDLDSNIDAIIQVALQKDPKDRYQSAGAMLSDVRRAMKGQAVTTKIKKVRPRATGYLIAAFLVTVGFIVVMYLNFATDHGPRGVPLPTPSPTSTAPTSIPTNLVGMTLEQAREAIKAAGLNLEQTIPVDSNSQPGVVLKVIPDPGSIVPGGSNVQLQISSGQVQVPQLLGVTTVEAQTLLTQANLLVKVLIAYDPNEPIDTVLAQAPDAGTNQNIGSQVTITINRQS
jgi:eukaryotic-like serine/threonine-protein kinase